MSLSRQQLDAMSIGVRMLGLQAVESLLYQSGQFIAVEARVFRSCQQAEAYLSAVLGGCVLQRLSPGHWPGGSPIVCVKRREALAAVSAFGNAENVNFVCVHRLLQHQLAQ